MATISAHLHSTLLILSAECCGFVSPKIQLSKLRYLDLSGCLQLMSLGKLRCPILQSLNLNNSIFPVSVLEEVAQGCNAALENLFICDTHILANFDTNTLSDNKSTNTHTNGTVHTTSSTTIPTPTASLSFSFPKLRILEMASSTLDNNVVASLLSKTDHLHSINGAHSRYGLSFLHSSHFLRDSHHF